MGGKVSAPQQNPFLTMTAMNNMNQANSLLNQGPTTSLPSDMRSHVTLQDAMGDALGADSMLPAFLQMSNRNPLLAQADTPQKIAQTYGNKIFDYSVKPQLGGEAIGQWLGGNLGTSGSSSFGANYMSNLEGTGRIQSFLQGQNYYDDLLNNMLNERNNLFGNEVQPALQASEYNDQANNSKLGMMNTYKLGQAQGLSGIAGQAMGWANNQQNQQMAASAATAQNRASLLGGMGGLIGGGIGMMMGRKNPMGGSMGSMGGGMSGGGGNWSSLSKPFGADSFALGNLGNY